MRRTWRREVPIARSMPSSRVRSKMVSESVLTTPKIETRTEAEKNVDQRDQLVDLVLAVLLELLLGARLGVREALGEQRVDLLASGLGIGALGEVDEGGRVVAGAEPLEHRVAGDHHGRR